MARAKRSGRRRGGYAAHSGRLPVGSIPPDRLRFFHGLLWWGAGVSSPVRLPVSPPPQVVGCGGRESNPHSLVGRLPSPGTRGMDTHSQPRGSRARECSPGPVGVRRRPPGAPGMLRPGERRDSFMTISPEVDRPSRPCPSTQQPSGQLLFAESIEEVCPRVTDSSQRPIRRNAVPIQQYPSCGYLPPSVQIVFVTPPNTLGYERHLGPSCST